MKVIVLLIFHNTAISLTKCSSGTTPKNFPFTSDGIQRGIFQLTSVPVLSDAVIVFS